MAKRTKLLIILTSALILLILLGFGTVKAGQFSKAKKQVDLGNKYFTDGKYKEAILAFEKAISVDRNNVEARIGAAKAYVEINELQKAEDILKKGIEFSPKKDELYLELSSLYLRKGKIVEAINILDLGYEKTESERIKKKLKEIDEQLSIVIECNPLQISKRTEAKLVLGEKNVSAKWELKGKKIGDLIKGDNDTVKFISIELGTQKIAAKVGSIEKTASIEVKNQVAASIDIVPLPSIGSLGDSVELRAIVKDQFGSEIDVEPTWQLSSDIAKLSTTKGKTNKVNYVKDGKVQLTVAYANINTTTEITISQKTFTISITTVGGGRVEVKGKKEFYHEGDVVELTAIANDKYKFMKWTGGIEGSQNPVTIKVQGNLNIQCVFGCKSLEGIVRYHSGDPTPQAVLKLRKGRDNFRGDIIYTATTKEDGTYELYYCEPGLYTITVYVCGEPFSWTYIEITNIPVRKDITLPILGG